jgi:sulfonate transport system permease protein
VALNTHEGIRSIAREHFEVARVFRLSPVRTFVRVVLPGAMPSVFAGLHLALVYSWLATIGAEYLLAPGRGIGNLMIAGRSRFAMDEVLLGVVCVGGVGYGVHWVAARAEARALRWRVRGT